MADRWDSTFRRRTEKSGRNLHGNRGHVVVLRRVAAEIARLLEYRVHDFPRRPVTVSSDDLADSPCTELLTALAGRFENSIGTEHEYVAALQRKRELVVMDVRKGPQRDTRQLDSGHTHRPST